MLKQSISALKRICILFPCLLLLPTNAFAISEASLGYNKFPSRVICQPKADLDLDGDSKFVCEELAEGESVAQSISAGFPVECSWYLTAGGDFDPNLTCPRGYSEMICKFYCRPLRSTNGASSLN